MEKVITQVPLNNPKFIIVHSTDVSYRISTDQLVSVNNYHRDIRGFPRSSLGYYVGYHNLITGGKNTRCRLDTDEGAHCNQLRDGLSMNFQSLGVCIGFDGDVEYPSQADTIMLRDQIWAWQDKHNIDTKNVLFHRDLNTGKTCPGSLITRTWLEQLVKRVPKAPIQELTVDVSVVMRLIEFFRKLGL